MLRLLVDTSVWLDLAKLRDGQRLIVPIRVLVSQGKLELLVPSLVLDEFARNRPRAEAAVTASVHERFRLLRNDLREYGGHERDQWIEEMTHRVPLVSAMTLQNFREIEELLRSGRRTEPSEADRLRVIQRALDKRAPFHRNKNSVADGLLIELYCSSVNGGDLARDDYGFVTSNYEDFSVSAGDRREPHPDMANCFNERSHYFHGVEGLTAALRRNFNSDFEELVQETDLSVFFNEPRTLAEILDAEQEYFDKVWYVRSLILEQRIEAGEDKPPRPEIAKKADAARRRIQEQYGAENLGPWADWEWGVVNGKLSALRWVLGEEWDFLDT